jgi:adenosylhomocysteine nucleosidase
MIGILGAMPTEIERLTQALETVEIHTHLERQFYQGYLADYPVVIVQGGIGKVRASITATALVCQFPLTGILFTGVAGALRPGLHRGDVILSTQVIEHDFGMARDEGFSLGLDFIVGEEAQTIQSDPELLTVAQQLTDTVLTPLGSYKPKIYTGLIASGDTFVAGARIRQQIYDRTQADVVEMEGVAVLRVAQASGIPCLLIRSVSDEGDSDVFLDFLEVAAANSATMVKAILSKLR